MKIIEHHGNIKLQYKQPIKHNKTTDKTTIPQEIIEYLDIKDTVYIYTNTRGQTTITTTKPSTEHHTCHVYKDHTINIPPTIIPSITVEDHILLILDLSSVDDYKNGLGLLTITTP